MRGLETLRCIVKSISFKEYFFCFKVCKNNFHQDCYLNDSCDPIEIYQDGNAKKYTNCVNFSHELDSLTFFEISRDIHIKDKLKCEKCKKRIESNRYYQSEDGKFNIHVKCHRPNGNTVEDIKNETEKLVLDETERFAQIKKKSMKYIARKKQDRVEISSRKSKSHFWEGSLTYSINENGEACIFSCYFLSVKLRLFFFRFLRIFGNWIKTRL